jgi:hypothetical protein
METDYEKMRAMKLIGSRVIVSVAQYPFELRSENGALNTFGTLVPVMKTDGEPLSAEDCPTEGLIFWLVKPPILKFAQPGRLLVATLEPAKRQEEHEYQAQPDAIDRPEDIAEILTPDILSVQSPIDLVNKEQMVDHPPTSLVLIRWGEHVYGPFRTEAQRDFSRWKVTLQAYYPDKSVLKIPWRDFLDTQKLQPHLRDNLKSTVSLENRSPTRNDVPKQDCEYQILLSGGFKQLPSLGYPRISLESNRDVLIKFVKRFAVKKKQQELRALLDELALVADASGLNASGGDRDAFNAVRDRLGRIQEDDYAVAKALVASGLIDQEMQGVMRERVDQYVQDNSAVLAAEISKRVEGLQIELSSLDRRKADFDDEFSGKHLTFERELESKRQLFEQALDRDRRQIEKEREELTKQRDEAGKLLSGLTQKFQESQTELIAQFLGLLPLFERIGISPTTQRLRDSGNSDSARVEQTVRTFQVPAFAKSDDSRQAAVTEEEYFERFEHHVKNRNFSYRRRDLAAFHVSIKCSDITILGGWSGTGKSSLPLLYMEAAAGESGQGLGRYLRVDVSPSWLDMRDLMGHLNSIEGRFQPAESGLYQHLITAAVEFDHRQQESGIYLVTLDEMNLSHVEHYFSGFLQALEQPASQRMIRCFDRISVDADSPFAEWAEIRIPRSLRFVGTVNFDETTKQLSQRLLDRANLVRLGAGELHQVSATDRDPVVSVPGPPLIMRDFREWTRSSGLDKEQASLLDTLRKHLQELGCPVTPRRYRAIGDFLASTPPWLMSPSEAFDLQIAQRLLPQIRGLFRPGARAALDAIDQALAQQPYEFDESRLALSDLRRNEESTLPFTETSTL